MLGRLKIGGHVFGVGDFEAGAVFGLRPRDKLRKPGRELISSRLEGLGVNADKTGRSLSAQTPKSCCDEHKAVYPKITDTETYTRTP